MGGKKKTNNSQPRTKGNIKPSSSEKAANFLVQQTGSLGIFNTNVFDSSIFINQQQLDASQPIKGKLSSFVPIMQDPEASNLDVRLLSVLKRLDKRDHITKQKALREFLELIVTESKDLQQVLDVEALNAALPFWPRIYCRLSFDSDRKVRELTQSVMHMIASRVGRNLVFHLKQIFPIWTFATVDSHEPAATLAHNGLHAIFPKSKLSDANRLYAGPLLDMVESRLSEIQSTHNACANPKPKSTQSSGKIHSPTGDFFSPNSTDEPNSSTSLNCEQRSVILKLATTLRFLASFIEDLSSLAADDDHLIRVRNLLAPENLWTQIANHLNSTPVPKSTSELAFYDEYTSSLYGSVYKLCTTLLTNRDWREWMKESDEGQQLAKYICLITIGSLGYSSKLKPNSCNQEFPNQMLILPPSCEQTNPCFSRHWEASLCCLTYLTKSVVWSVVNWSETLVPRLDYLLSHGGLGHSKQVYPNLLCLLHEFPLDYSSLTQTEQDIINHVFIDSSLKGLIKTLQSSSLTKSQPVTSESFSGLTSSFFDPFILVLMISGILESARYLVDRLLTPIETTPNSEFDLSQQCPLVHRIFNEIILRLLSDSLNLYRPTVSESKQEAEQEVIRLFCTHTPASRQAYLDAVFTQIAQLCNNLAESKNSGKEHLFTTIRHHLLSWINEKTLVESQGHVTRLYLGIIDPLRFAHFLDALAKAGTRKFGRSTAPSSPAPSTTAKKSLNNSTRSSEKLPIISADWCVELFQTLAEILQSQIVNHPDSHSVDPTKSNCFHIIIFLSLYGYLPLIQIPIPNLLGQIFTLVLAELPREVHTLCWSPAVIRGLAKTWIHTDKPIDEIDISSSSLSSSIYLNYITHVLPPMLDILPLFESKSPGLSNPLFDRISTLLTYWIRKWFSEALTSASPNPTETLNKIHILLGIGLQSLSQTALSSASSSPSSVLIVQLFSQLLVSLSDELNSYTSSMKSTPLVQLRIFATIYLYVLETHNNLSKLFPQSVEQVNQMYSGFSQVLFHLYTVDIFGDQTVMSSKPKLHQPDLIQDEDLPVDNVLLSIPDLIEQAENLLIDRLTFELKHNLSDPDSFSPLFLDSCFGAITQSSLLNPMFFKFLSRLNGFVKQTATSDSNANFVQLWIEHTNQQTLSMLKAFHQMGYTNLGTRHLLPCLDLVPMSLVSHLAPLVKLHLTGIYLKLYLELNDQQFKHYIILMGLARVWISSLNEPVDWCTDFGWPSQINPFDPTLDQTGRITDPNLEVSRSLFANAFESVMAKKLGQFWHRLTQDLALQDLLGLCDQFEVTNSDEAWQIRYPHWNALLFNRIRTIHPNMWPRELKLAASLTDDRRTGQSWFEMHLLNPDPLGPSFQDPLAKVCELYIPSGIVRRCFPRQEFLTRLKTIPLDDSKEFKAADSEDRDNIIRSRILELLSCMTSVRFAAPIYITTFMPLVFENFQNWLASLADVALNELESCPNTLPPTMFRTALSIMSFLEALLMLWQPWQWCTDIADKSPLSNHAGLIQLSLRIRELRPIFDQTQWDFILCSVISWVNTTVAWLNLKSKTKEDQARALAFGFRAFRLAAALGAMFVKRSVCLSSMSSLITLKPNPKTEVESWETLGDVDIEDDESPDDHQLNPDQADEAETTSKSPNKPAMDYEDFDMETMGDLIGDEDDNDDGDDDGETESFGKTLNKGVPLIPTRGPLPASVQSEWDNFFSNHLYSALLPLVFEYCLPNHLNKQEVTLDCESYIQALCASFSTCSASQLIQILTDKPQLVMEFLVDIKISSTSLNARQLIQSSRGSTFDLTPGLRSSLDLACKLMAKSPHQSGQLLGHALLNRMFSIKAPSSSGKPSVSLGNYLVHRLPTSWLSTLYGLFPSDLEDYLVSEMALDIWGRGSVALKFLISSSVENGFALNQTIHQAILAYLLAWDSLLNLLSCVGPQTRACLQNALLGSSAVYFDRFMLMIGLLLPPSTSLDKFSDMINRLEPDERLLLPNSSTRMTITAALSLCSSKRRLRRPIPLMTPPTPGDDTEWRDAFFPDDSLLRLPGHRSALDLTHYAVRLFRRFLAEAPALMRSWHNQLTSIPISQTSDANESEALRSSDMNSFTSLMSTHRTGRLRQFAGVMDKLVSRHFSLGLARDHVVLVQYKSQLRLLQEEDASKGLFSILNSTPEVGSVRITGYPLSRELIASYHMTDEHSMNILIQLPENYPLSPVTVEKSRGIGVSNQQWQSWICQLSVFINSHNGSILDGIDLWQNNARKKFEGVEECAICYSVVHSTSFSLPKMKCHTCRKLFHHACMYRWFQTSKNPACPLCRHIFFRPSGRPT